MRKILGLLAMAAVVRLAWMFLAPLVDGTAFWLMLGGILLGALLILGGIFGFLASLETAAIVRAARAGHHRDGARTAVHGTVVADGEPLIAPLTGEPCVAFDLDIHRHETRRTSSRSSGSSTTTVKKVLAFGLGQTSYSLLTVGEGEPMRVAVRGLTLLEHLPKTEAPAGARGRAEELFRNPDVQKTKAGGLNAFPKLLKEMREADGDAWMVYRDESEALEDDWVFGEKILRPGEPVTLFGRWNEDERAVSTHGNESLDLVPGGYDEAEKILVSGRRFSLGCGLVFGIAILVLIYFLAHVRAKEHPLEKPAEQSMTWPILEPVAASSSG